MSFIGLKRVFFALAVFGTSGCIATPKAEDATLAYYMTSSIDSAETSGVAAFEKTFYAFARENCASCHGGSQSPLFAVSNPAAAYSIAKDASYVNFGSPSASKFATYSGNGHCGLPGCSDHAADASAEIQAWAAVELAATIPTPSGGGSAPTTPSGDGPPTGGSAPGAYVTTTLAIPASLPSGVNYVPMRWTLSNLKPSSAQVAGAIFELEIQKLSSTTYRVRNPKIVGLRSITRVAGVHVFVKPSSDGGIGVEDLGAGSVWEDIVVNVPSSMVPTPVPTTPFPRANFAPLDPYSMVIGVRSNQDSLTVSFDRLDVGSVTAPTFAAINADILAPKCLACHNPNNRRGGKSFASYADTLQSVVPRSPTTSRLYLSTSGANPTMPSGSLKLSAAEQNAISTWIMNGAPNN